MSEIISLFRDGRPKTVGFDVQGKLIKTKYQTGVVSFLNEFRSEILTQLTLPL